MELDPGFAPAKINLALHVTGQRDDGYHLLDTIVVFAQDVGDRISLEQINTKGRHSLRFTGPYTRDLEGKENNLVMQTLDRITQSMDLAMDLAPPGFEVKLEKNLPISSGIGGGSADAAAAYRLVVRALREAGYKQFPPPQTAIPGADGPMCFHSRAIRAGGIGDAIEFLSPPMLHLLLVNPGVPVSTPKVFDALTNKMNDGLADPPVVRDIQTWVDYLAAQRNDLQRPAMDHSPVIAQCLGIIEETMECHLARMSGSGATCFGIYEDRAAAQSAKTMIDKRFPQWWTAVTTTV